MAVLQAYSGAVRFGGTGGVCCQPSRGKNQSSFQANRPKQQPRVSDERRHRSEPNLVMLIN